MHAATSEPTAEGSRPWPPSIAPSQPGTSLAAWIKDHRPWIDRTLETDGALWLRGFPAGDELAFEAAAREACERLHAEYGDLPRGEQRFVYGATPYPPQLRIHFHNEASHTKSWPLRILFHCIEAAEEGGESTLVDGRRVLHGLSRELVARFRDGLVYLRNFGGLFDVPWQSFFRTNDRAEVEARLRRHGVRYTWTEHGLRTHTRCPAMVVHPRIRQPVWFNQLRLHHPACLEPRRRSLLESRLGPEELPRNVLFADGTPIPDDVIEEIGRVMDESAVSVALEPGETLLLDNVLVAHAREPYRGRRRIVVAMGDLVDGAEE